MYVGACVILSFTFASSLKLLKTLKHFFKICFSNYFTFSGIENSINRILQTINKNGHPPISIEVKSFFPRAKLIITESDHTEDPASDLLTVTLIPAVRGDGWPPGTRLQHALSRKQLHRGKRCLEEIDAKVADGQTMWFLEAKSINLPDSINFSSRFRQRMRQYRFVDRLWKLSLAPAQNIVIKNLRLACQDNDPPIEIQNITNILACIFTDHNCFNITADILRSILLWTFKRHMQEMKNIGECFLYIMETTIAVLQKKACPHFLMPNWNVIRGLEEEDIDFMVKELDHVLKEVRKNPAYVLRYVGYPLKS